MRVLRNPVAQFLAAGLVIVVAVALGSDQLSRRAAEHEAIADATAMTEVLAHAVAEPAIPLGLDDGGTRSADRFGDAIGDKLGLEDIQRIKIWNADGTIVWSDEPRLIGQVFDLGQGPLAVLNSGDARGDLTRTRVGSQHRYEIKADGLLEVYTRIESPDGAPLLFEVYYSAAQLEDTTALVLDAFRPITVGGALLVGLMTVPLLWGLNRRLASSSASRERLLRAAVDASEGERRRIARDLHEGVGRRLRDVTEALARDARDPATPPATVRRLLEVDDALRASIEALRSMVLEIYPPDLDAGCLGEALDQLVAPAEKAGLDVQVEVGDLVGASQDAVALVWRVAREGIRNAVSHARATTLAVSVRRSPALLELRIVDNGVGFVPGAFAAHDRLGLRGLQDLASEAGGRLSVSSGPGRGTALTLELPTG